MSSILSPTKKEEKGTLHRVIVESLTYQFRYVISLLSLYGSLSLFLYVFEIERGEIENIAGKALDLHSLTLGPLQESLAQSEKMIPRHH